MEKRKKSEKKKRGRGYLSVQFSYSILYLITILYIVSM